MSRLLKDWIALIPDWIETKCNILIREITFEPKKEAWKWFAEFPK